MSMLRIAPTKFRIGMMRLTETNEINEREEKDEEKKNL